MANKYTEYYTEYMAPQYKALEISVKISFKNVHMKNHTDQNLVEICLLYNISNIYHIPDSGLYLLIAMSFIF